MRFTSSTLTGALRAATQSPAYRMANQKQAFGALRQYSTETTPKKSGSKLLLATLVGAGIAGGLAYNSSQTKVVVSENPVKPPVSTEPKPTLFGKEEGFVSLKLAEVQHVSHDTNIFRFELPEGHTAGLKVASCVVTKIPGKDGKPVIRPYTPISEEETVGHIDFLIKKYNDGKFTPLLFDLQPGDTVEFKGPIMKYDWEKDQKAHVGMIAGGTGVTPMLQIIRRVFHEETGDKKTKITLLFANQTEADILLKEELEKFAKAHPDRFKIVYTLDKAEENWSGAVGYVDSKIIKANLPAPDQEDSVIFVCGPPPMVSSIAGAKDKMKQGELKGILKELGYKQENVFKF